MSSSALRGRAVPVRVRVRRRRRGGDRTRTRARPAPCLIYTDHSGLRSQLRTAMWNRRTYRPWTLGTSASLWASRCRSLHLLAATVPGRTRTAVLGLVSAPTRPIAAAAAVTASVVPPARRPRPAGPSSTIYASIVEGGKPVCPMYIVVVPPSVGGRSKQDKRLGGLRCTKYPVLTISSCIFCVAFAHSAAQTM